MIAITSGWNSSAMKNCSAGWSRNATPSAVPTHALPVRKRASRNTGTAPSAATHDLRDVEEVRAAARASRRGRRGSSRASRGGRTPGGRGPSGTPEVREQPDALVVDAHVEVDGCEAVVLQVDEDREDHDPDDDGDRRARSRGRRLHRVGVGLTGWSRRLRRRPRPAVRRLSSPWACMRRIATASSPSTAWAPVELLTSWACSTRSCTPAKAGSSRCSSRSRRWSAAFEPEMQRRSDDELRALTANFRGRLDQAG